MHTNILEASLFGGPLPVITGGVGLVFLIVMASRRPLRRWLPRVTIAALGGIGLGFLLAWLIGDVWNSFGISLTFVTRTWFAITIAAICVAIVSAWGANRRRVLTAVPAIVVFLVVGAIGINADFGEFPTLSAAFGLTHLAHLKLVSGAHGTTTATGPLWQTWQSPAGMPRHGKIGTVVIRGTVSHFSPRQAIVYEPPAALVKSPPALPVLEMLSGQPGSPGDIVSSGQIPAIVDQFAVAHDGLAPIIVIPDQLGSPAVNPMCVDSGLGNVATYLTTDVPNWIRAHFRVLTGAKYWAIGGFSEGGTCSIQLGSAYPRVFGGILDVSGELVPANGSVQHTILVGFHGSTKAYESAAPVNQLKRGAPYSSTIGVFGVGSNDAAFAAGARTLVAAARSAGMAVHFILSPGTAHDWHTVQFVVRKGLPLFYSSWGLAK